MMVLRIHRPEDHHHVVRAEQRVTMSVRMEAETTVASHHLHLRTMALAGILLRLGEFPKQVPSKVRDVKTTTVMLAREMTIVNIKSAAVLMEKLSGFIIMMIIVMVIVMMMWMLSAESLQHAQVERRF